MAKNVIIVVDLDKTLIDFDSFRILTLRNIYKFRVLYLLLLRKLRIISSFKFKKQIMTYLINRNGKEYFNQFADELTEKININILGKITNIKSTNDLIVVLSASPQLYVSIIAKNMGWIGYGSTFSGIDENNQDRHLYGNEKLNFLLNNYPLNLYKYKYGISDSFSDLKMLSYFDNYELIKTK
ncbi:hypothetical protein TRIP_D260011 [uncultured Paludibacter sp.]|nr:hypothetical protein TRIP_D260011 [uncultured Paludibacter sp.]